jgi:hypothetical protein
MAAMPELAGEAIVCMMTCCGRVMDTERRKAKEPRPAVRAECSGMPDRCAARTARWRGGDGQNGRDGSVVGVGEGGEVENSQGVEERVGFGVCLAAGGQMAYGEGEAEEEAMWRR